MVLAHQARRTAQVVRGMCSLLLQPGGFLVLAPPLLPFPLPPGALRVHDPHLNEALHSHACKSATIKVVQQRSSRHESRSDGVHCSHFMHSIWLPGAQMV